MFWIRNKKKCIPHISKFYYIRMGSKGYILHGHVFVILSLFHNAMTLNIIKGFINAPWAAPVAEWLRLLTSVLLII